MVNSVSLVGSIGLSCSLLVNALCYAAAEGGYATVCRLSVLPSVLPSVCLSVTFRYCDHIA